MRAKFFGILQHMTSHVFSGRKTTSTLIARVVEIVSGSPLDHDPVGYLGRDEFGRVFFDQCASSEEHFKAPEFPLPFEKPGEHRRRCRVYLEELFLPMVGRKVSLSGTLIIKEVEEE